LLPGGCMREEWPLIPFYSLDQAGLSGLSVLQRCALDNLDEGRKTPPMRQKLSRST
jgi:hypothetical protein